MAKDNKTNAMRKLDSMKLDYKEHYYTDTGAVSGIETAQALGEEPERVFKTLVTEGKSGAHYVFMIPVAEAGEKSAAMIKAKELLPLTGYIHGGCSPIGMKKQFRTFIHLTAEDFDTIYCSGGKIGFQIELPLSTLRKVIRVESADLIR